VNSNNEIQGYKLYPMLHFRRKFSSSITASPRGGHMVLATAAWRSRTSGGQQMGGVDGLYVHVVLCSNSLSVVAV